MERWITKAACFFCGKSSFAEALEKVKSPFGILYACEECVKEKKEVIHEKKESEMPPSF